MRINAYVLLADPTWIRTSVGAYYQHVDRIVASYDETSRGWTGAPVRTEECLAALREIDLDNKVDYRPGHYAKIAESPLDGETIQRGQALAAAANGADWVLQLDTDEVLPSFPALSRVLKEAETLGVGAVEWPMRVLYRALPRGGYLEVMDDAAHHHVDYPGPIAVRPDKRLVACRRVDGPFVRPIVEGHDRSIQVVRPCDEDEIRSVVVDLSDVIWHNSWARPARETAAKIASWGHSAGLRSWIYFAFRWLPSPLTWRRVHDWHPFSKGLWPELAVVPGLPFDLHAEDES